MSDINEFPHLTPKFPLGEIVGSLNTQEKLGPADVSLALERHGACDWGDVSPEDSDANDSALWGGGRLVSVYHDRYGLKFYIITEADRQRTTILLAEDY